MLTIISQYLVLTRILRKNSNLKLDNDERERSFLKCLILTSFLGEWGETEWKTCSWLV